MFKTKNITPMQVGKNGIVPCHFSYYNEDDDAVATITASGYIPFGNNIRNRDQIDVISSDGSKSKKYYATVGEDNHITLTASTNA